MSELSPASGGSGLSGAETPTGRADAAASGEAADHEAKGQEARGAADTLRLAEQQADARAVREGAERGVQRALDRL